MKIEINSVIDRVETFLNENKKSGVQKITSLPLDVKLYLDDLRIVLELVKANNNIDIKKEKLLSDLQHWHNLYNDKYDEVEKLKVELENKAKELKDEKEYHQMDIEMLQKYHKENSDFKYKILTLRAKIDKMIEYINEVDGSDNICNKMPSHMCKNCEDCIREYFGKGIEDDR